MAYVTQPVQGEELNRPYADDLPVHEWYRFVLSFPPHLIRSYLERFDVASTDCVLDPFCGTGTTLVEAKKNGVRSVGTEANPVVHFAASVKTDWAIAPERFLAFAESVAEIVREDLSEQQLFTGPLFRSANGELKLRTLDNERQRLLIKDSISPIPLHKALCLRDAIDAHPDQPFHRHARLALAKQLVTTIGNLRFGPEVGVGKVKENAPVVSAWLDGVQRMAEDLEVVRRLPAASATVYHGDARALAAHIAPASINAVITSPPYPNEKDYSRTTRLESVLLGFLNSRQALRQQKKGFLRSNTRAVYKGDDDDRWIEGVSSVIDLAAEIEARRIELGKTSGFERNYARVVRLYFGGMARHLEALKPLLRPGAQLAYVVGDQASFFRIMIRTGTILAEIAERLGYEVVDIDLFRTRFSTATKDYLREEVVILRWKGQ
ncbi:MAG: hypothetical protein KDD73_09910 [Anaerolineales bacterium]|nr:hypothetical protein [Anaerolineales bacterium]MCB9126674.1 DNA methyltransferase [Ardenticatenales bacterium]MCB9171786.1 DNA methyltransferase [Ardenticatenales bacterium]